MKYFVFNRPHRWIFNFIIGLTLLSSLTASAEIAFFGRNYEMYKQMFCLNDEDFVGKSILDAPGGPSTFLATLKDKGLLEADSKAVDIAYGDLKSVTELIEKGMRMAFVPYYDESYKALPEQRQQQLVSAVQTFTKIHQEFLGYYSKYPDLYVRGDIRDIDQVIPQDIKYDLVFSANLLFLYSERALHLDEKFHYDSILSLAQKLKEKGELRLFPLDTLTASIPPFLDHLVEGLRKEGLSVEIKDGCAPSTGQIMTSQYHVKGKMMIVSKKSVPQHEDTTKH